MIWMSESLKLTGIYNQEIIQLGLKEEISHFGFDFRPRSPNFLQEYAFKEIIENNFEAKMQYYLHYQDEKDFMIFRMVDEVKNSILDMGRELKHLDQFTLFFSDVKEISYYQSMPLNFIWEYHPLGKIEEIAQCQNNVGLSVTWDSLQDLIKTDSLNEFVLKILKVKQMRQSKFPESGPYQVSLQLDWSSDVVPSLGEFLTFDQVELPINSLVESSYRNIDVLKVKTGLKDIKNITIQKL